MGGAVARSRKGQLQDNDDAPGDAGDRRRDAAATGLISSAFNFLALLITAFLIYASAAQPLLVSGTLLFVLLRPCASSVSVIHESSPGAVVVRERRQRVDQGHRRDAGVRPSAPPQRDASTRSSAGATPLLQHAAAEQTRTESFQSLIIIALVIALGAVAAAGGAHSGSGSRDHPAAHPIGTKRAAGAEQLPKACRNRCRSSSACCRPSALSGEHPQRRQLALAAVQTLAFADVSLPSGGATVLSASARAR